MNDIFCMFAYVKLKNIFSVCSQQYLSVFIEIKIKYRLFPEIIVEANALKYELLLFFFRFDYRKCRVEGKVLKNSVKQKREICSKCLSVKKV